MSVCAAPCSSARSQLSSHTNQKQQAPSGTRKTGGWGNGNLAQPGTLMLDDDEGTVDELEVSGGACTDAR
eukprot:12802-Pelagomonas_calceolata.AAC.4